MYNIIHIVESFISQDNTIFLDVIMKDIQSLERMRVVKDDDP